MGDLVEDVDQLPHPNALEGSEPLVLVALEQQVQQLPGHGRDLGGALHGEVVDPPQNEGGAGRGAAETGEDEVGAARDEEGEEYVRRTEDDGRAPLAGGDVEGGDEARKVA